MKRYVIQLALDASYLVKWDGTRNGQKWTRVNETPMVFEDHQLAVTMCEKIAQAWIEHGFPNYRDKLLVLEAHRGMNLVGHEVLL